MAEPTTIDEIREEREKGKLQIAKGKLQAKLEFRAATALWREAAAAARPGAAVRCDAAARVALDLRF